MGLDLIPGEIHPIEDNQYQIGWNHLISKKVDISLWYSPQDNYYLTIHIILKAQNYIYATAFKNKELPAIIRNKNIYGIQFNQKKVKKAVKIL